MTRPPILPWLALAFLLTLWTGPLAAEALTSNGPGKGGLSVGYRVMDLNSSDGKSKSSITVAVWYPTRESPRSFAYGGRTSGHVAVDAEPLGASGPYPLLVFSHGYGGSGLGAVFLTEALAARGWIVVAPDHRDRHSAVRIRSGQPEDFDRLGFLRHALEISRSGPGDRKDYRYRVDEMRTVLDGILESKTFGPLIDRRRIAVGGHSFGGFTALGVCGAFDGRRHDGIKALLLFSSGAAGYLYTDSELAAVKVPSLHFIGEREQSDRRGDRSMRELADKIHGNVPPPKHLLLVRGGTHFTFNNCLSDRMAARWLSGSEEQFDTIRRYSIAFLERYVCGRADGEAVLDGEDRMLTLRRVSKTVAAAAQEGAAGRVRAGREGAREMAGTQDRTMRHRGIERNYRLYVPGASDPAKPGPLVVALHGGFGTGKGMEKLSASGFNKLADRDGFVVAYPDGVERHWNDGREGVSYRAHGEKIDDVGFIGALIDQLVQEFNLDPSRVYVTGASNGAMMSYRLAIEMSGKIAAIAPVMCPLQTEYAAAVPPVKMPVLVIHGADDPLAPFEGGPILILSGRKKIGEVISIERTVQFWVQHNGASPTAVTKALPDADPSDGTRTKQEVHVAGEGGAEVVLYTVNGGGHTWPGGWQYLGERFIGKTSRDFDATAVIWEFFRRHSRKSRQ